MGLFFQITKSVILHTHVRKSIKIEFSIYYEIYWIICLDYSIIIIKSHVKRSFSIKLTKIKMLVKS